MSKIQRVGPVNDAWEVLEHDGSTVLLPLDVAPDGRSIDLTGIESVAGGSFTVMWTEQE